MEKEIKSLEERVSKLEHYRENDRNQIHQLDTSLQVFINEMKNISEDLKTVVSNFKEAIIRSTTAQEKEIELLKERNEKLEKRVEILDTKLEQETIGADAEKWKKVTSYIVTALVGAIITFAFAKIGLK